MVLSTMVNNAFYVHKGSLSWNIIFGRGLQDWELDDYTLLLTSLYEVYIKVKEDNCSRWRLAQDVIFSVDTYFRSLLGLMENSFP